GPLPRRHARTHRATRGRLRAGRSGQVGRLASQGATGGGLRSGPRRADGSGDLLPGSRVQPRRHLAASHLASVRVPKRWRWARSWLRSSSSVVDPAHQAIFAVIFLGPETGQVRAELNDAFGSITKPGND